MSVFGEATVIPIAFALTLTGCTPTAFFSDARTDAGASTPGGIRVTQLNLAPHVPRQTPHKSYTLEVDEAPEVEALLARIYVETRVNDAVTVGEYIDLKVAGDEATQAEIRSKMPRPERQKWRMTAWAGEQDVLQFYGEGVNYSGRQVEDLRRLVEKLGTVSNNSPAVQPKRRPDATHP